MKCPDGVTRYEFADIDLSLYDQHLLADRTIPIGSPRSTYLQLSLAYKREVVNCLNIALNYFLKHKIHAVGLPLPHQAAIMSRSKLFPLRTPTGGLTVIYVEDCPVYGWYVDACNERSRLIQSICDGARILAEHERRETEKEQKGRGKKGRTA